MSFLFEHNKQTGSLAFYFAEMGYKNTFAARTCRRPCIDFLCTRGHWYKCICTFSLQISSSPSSTTIQEKGRANKRGRDCGTPLPEKQSKRTSGLPPHPAVLISMALCKTPGTGGGGGGRSGCWTCSGHSKSKTTWGSLHSFHV